MFTAKRWLSLAVVVAFSASETRAAELLNKYLPEDTEVVVGFNVTAVLESGLIQKHVPALLKKYGPDFVQLGIALSGQKIDDDLSKAITKTLTDSDAVRKWLNDNKKVVRRLVIGTTADFDDGNAFLILEGDFNKEKLKEVFANLAKDKPLGVTLKTVKEGKHEFYGVKVPGEEEEMYVALADDANIVCCQDKMALAKALDRSDRKEPAVRKELIEVATRIGGDASLWMVAVPKKGDDYVSAHAYVVVTDGIKLFASVTNKDADSAMTTANDLKGTLKDLIEEIEDAAKQLPPLTALRDVVKKIEPKAEKSVVTVEAELPGATIDKLIKELPANK